MTKKILGAFCISLALASCGGGSNTDKANGNGYLIDGTVAGVDEGMVYMKRYDDRSYTLTDSAEVKDGKFRFMGVALQPLLYGLTTDKDSNRPQTFFLDNESMTVVLDEEKGSLTVEGSEINDLYSQNAVKVGTDSFDMAAFAAQHPASAVVPYFIVRSYGSLDLEPMKALRASIDSTLDGNLCVKQLDNLIARKEAIQVGREAPDFTLPDKDGNSVSLSSMRGKYVLIDFWASWCPDCRRENPYILEAYNKYKGKGLSVLGVSLDRNRDAWLAGIEKENLQSWTHVSDLKMWNSDVVALYAIRWIPTSILVDPEGKIVFISLDETQLVENLKKVFG